MMADINV